MHEILYGLVIWGIVSPIVAGCLVNRYPRYKKHTTTDSSPRMNHNIQFGFTLDGNLTGEIVPEGLDPTKAAIIRSKREKKTYGSRRI